MSGKPTAIIDIGSNSVRLVVYSAGQRVPFPIFNEKVLAGLGVISGIPGADGIAGDLGGGSLELVDVAAGQASAPMSMPLGVLRLGAGGDGQQDGEDRAAAIGCTAR